MSVAISTIESDRLWRRLYSLGCDAASAAVLLHIPVELAAAELDRIAQMSASRWAWEEACKQRRSSWGCRLPCR